MAFADLLKKRTIYDPAPAEATPVPTQTPTAAPAVPETPKQKIPSPWGGFTADNIGQYWYGADLNPLSQQTGISRDDLAGQRDAFVQSQEQNLRAGGQRVDATSANNLLSTISQSQSGQPAGASRAPSSYNFSNFPGFQFDDPYTTQLEDLVRQNLQAIQKPQSNPALDSLLQFLNTQFTDLSTSPGYSPDELALIRTQMQEPIERDRAAGRQRVLERTAARGMLPSSGLHEQDLQDLVDRPADERRIAASRDIAINAIDQRRKDIDRALNLGRVAGVEIPGLQRAEDQGRRAEALNLSSLLYDLPNRAMQSAQSVVNGTPGPENLFNQAIALQQAQQQQQALNAQKWAQIGQLIAGLF